MMTTRILFLDFDGVCNAHERHPNGYCGLRPDKLALLDWIVQQTQCRIVLVSAWRYLLLNGSMTLDGFRSLLLTHGASVVVCKAIIDYLGEDRDFSDPHDRGKMARAWLDNLFARSSRGGEVIAVALDDLPDAGYRQRGIPCVEPNGAVGLTQVEAARVVRLLNGEG